MCGDIRLRYLYINQSERGNKSHIFPAPRSILRLEAMETCVYAAQHVCVPFLSLFLFTQSPYFLTCLPSFFLDLGTCISLFVRTSLATWQQTHQLIMMHCTLLYIMHEECGQFYRLFVTTAYSHCILRLSTIVLQDFTNLGISLSGALASEIQRSSAWGYCLQDYINI